MIEEESRHMGHPPKICEINVDSNRLFLDVFGIAMLPTLVYKGHELTGLPDRGDLRSFLLQAIAEGCSITTGRPLTNDSKLTGSLEHEEGETVPEIAL